MATNPILTEINGLSPGAKTALLNAHQASSPPATPAPIAGLHAPSQIPSAPMMGAAPQPPVNGAGLAAATPGPMPKLAPPTAPNVALSPSPRGTLIGDQEKLSHDLSTGSGISQIHSKIENSSFGQKHPFLGKLAGWGAQIPAQIADIGVSALAPAITANTPGTEYHHLRDIKQDQGQIAGDTANEGRQAEAANQTAQAGEHTETTNLMPEKAADLHAQSEATTANLQAAQGPSLATAYAHAVNDAMKNGRNPSADPIVQHLADAITSLQKQPAEPGGPKTISKEVHGQEHTFAYDPATKDYTKDEGLTGTKPPTINLNEGRKEDIAQRGVIAKTYQPVMDSAERYNVMAKNYEDAVKNHDQQAMLSLLYNHMGMTMGLQKGARMTKDLIHEAQQSQPWLQGIKAHYDSQGYLSGVVLSPQQMQEMVSNARGRYSEDVVKARNESKYLGATDDGPQRTPNQSVINYYTHLAGGDPAKAKQLAAQDGWSIQ